MALTICLQTFNKIYRQVIDHGMGMLIQPVKMTINNLQQYYIYCSKLYFLDKFIWSAMFTEHDEIFYRSADDDAWR